MANKKSNWLKRAEFAQRIVVISWAVTIVWISLSFILAFLGKDTNSNVTITLIKESFGVTVAYFIYQAVLKTSRNKYGVDCDGIPFKVKQKLNESLFGNIQDIDIDTDISDTSDEGGNG